MRGISRVTTGGLKHLPAEGRYPLSCSLVCCCCLQARALQSTQRSDVHRGEGEGRGGEARTLAGYEHLWVGTLLHVPGQASPLGPSLPCPHLTSPPLTCPALPAPHRACPPSPHPDCLRSFNTLKRVLREVSLRAKGRFEELQEQVLTCWDLRLRRAGQAGLLPGGQWSVRAAAVIYIPAIASLPPSCARPLGQQAFRQHGPAHPARQGRGGRVGGRQKLAQQNDG